MKKKFDLIDAFHPTMFEKDVYHVHFNEKGQHLVDRFSQSFDVKAKNRKEAIKMARNKLRF